MTDKEKRSCVGTIRTLMSLAYNVHGVMDSVDADNCERIIKLINSQPKPKKGRWLNNRSDIGPWFICSECGDEVYETGNYCTTCGSYNGGEETGNQS